MKRLVRVLIPVILPATLGACGADNPVGDLNTRMTGSLGPQIKANQASVQPAVDGTIVRIPEDRLFVSPYSSELSDLGRFMLISVTQALLAPEIMRIEVVPGAEPAPPALAAARAETIRAFYANAQFAAGIPIVLPGPPPAEPGISAPGQITIAVHVISAT